MSTAGGEDLATCIAADVARALAEDVGTGDVTAALVPATTWYEAEVLGREGAVVCGIDWFDETFRQLDRHVTVGWLVAEGEEVAAGRTWCRLEGPGRALLTGERTALNFLQTLSGTATTVRAWASVLAGTPTRLLDTRKTLPGLRRAQKHAVRVGGGSNHRMGLWDALLVKENHVLACGSITAAVDQARALHPGLPLEVEVENLAELDEALAAGVTRVLLDDFDDARLVEALARAAGRAEVEVSGGVDRARLAALAALGVDAVSVGALTKHVRAIDLSMRFLAAADAAQ